MTAPVVHVLIALFTMNPSFSVTSAYIMKTIYAVWTAVFVVFMSSFIQNLQPKAQK